MNKQKTEPEPTATPPAEPAEFPAVEFDLTLEDTLSQQQRGLAPKGQKGTGGYNPYDTPVRSPPADPAAAEPKRKPTDLRKLSEWIRLQRQVEALKKDPPDSK